MTEFRQDLKNEKRLAVYLDSLYPELLPNFEIERVTDLGRQMEGCDLIIKKDEKTWCIDEKAQLDYLNKRLPTFAFELSYLKNGYRNSGWLHDSNKKTDHYFLITAICTDENCGDFSACQIMSVDRMKLIDWLDSHGLNKQYLHDLDEQIRLTSENGRIILPELNVQSEGFIHFSKSNKSEQPINLVLRLNMLKKEGLGKELKAETNN